MPVAVRGRGWRWGLVALFVLLLVACGSSGGGDQPPAAAGQPTAIVATVEPSGELTTAVPLASPTVAPTATPPAPLAAVVNGQYIFLAEYERQVTQYEQALQEMGVDLNTQDGQDQLAQARQDVLEGLIEEALVEQGAAALGVAVTEEELETQVEADIAAGGGQAAFDGWLQSTSQTREDYKTMLRQSLISQRVWDIVAADVPTTAEQVHARIIVVASEEEARQILALLQAGGDFVALARERSLDLATKDNGGDLDWFPRGVVAPELENAAFALQPGGISEPISVGEGFHILQVVEREAARPLSPDMQLLLQQDRFDQWLEELRAKAVIERFVGE
jgi:parvulin-like peptidyl-prolyl isomerase